MRVTVIADEGDSDIGFIGERLEELGARFENFQRDDPPDTGSVVVHSDVLVLLGSDRSVHDPTEGRVVAREQGLLRASTAAGLPVLAICYGAQLAASALGASVEPSPKPEFGWLTIESDDPRIIENGPWFEFHYDRFGDVPGVPAIAHSVNAPQAFVHGRTLAVQFHPEVTARTARRWLLADAEQIAARGFEPEAIVAESVALESEARIRCYVLVDRFLSEIAMRPPVSAR